MCRRRSAGSRRLGMLRHAPSLPLLIRPRVGQARGTLAGGSQPNPKRLRRPRYGRCLEPLSDLRNFQLPLQQGRPLIVACCGNGELNTVPRQVRRMYEYPVFLRRGMPSERRMVEPGLPQPQDDFRVLLMHQRLRIGRNYSSFTGLPTTSRQKTSQHGA